jgi:hypothetical protein
LEDRMDQNFQAQCRRIFQIQTGLQIQPGFMIRRFAVGDRQIA